MIPNLEIKIRALKLAGFTDLQAKVLALIFQTNQLDWSYLLRILEKKEREKNKWMDLFKY